MSMMQTFRDGPRRAPRMLRGIWNLALAVGYAWLETAYFGWNLLPKSGAEMACDGIALLLLIVTSERMVTLNGERSNG